jgi:hypothetical protein
MRIRNSKMVTLSLGNKKKTYPSIKAAALETGIPYMTLYMRLRMGLNAKKALTKPVRTYNKKTMN